MTTRVELVTTHLAEDGTRTVEAAFVDDDGNWGSELAILPDGTMEVRSLREGEEA